MTDNYNLNKNRMTVPEKKMNFEDLQVIKLIIKNYNKFQFLGI